MKTTATSTYMRSAAVRSRPPITGRPTPESPFDPPVTEVHWNAIANTICARARVSMRKKMPAERTARRPITRASADATRVAAPSPTRRSSLPSRCPAIAAA